MNRKIQLNEEEVPWHPLKELFCVIVEVFKKNSVHVKSEHFYANRSASERRLKIGCYFEAAASRSAMTGSGESLSPKLFQFLFRSLYPSLLTSLEKNQKINLRIR